MADKIYKVICPDCRKERIVSRSSFSLIYRKKISGRCCSCASKNKPRIADYEKSLYQSRLYRIWSNIKTRCLNPNSPNYKRYGGRGITICNKWMKFSGFLNDMASTYKDGLTIERIDNDKGYLKENCRWASKQEQALNTNNIKRAQRYKLGNDEFTIRELSKMFDIKRTTLGMRLQKYNWSLKEALLK